MNVTETLIVECCFCEGRENITGLEKLESGETISHTCPCGNIKYIMKEGKEPRCYNNILKHKQCIIKKEDHNTDLKLKKCCITKEIKGYCQSPNEKYNIEFETKLLNPCKCYFCELYEPIYSRIGEIPWKRVIEFAKQVLFFLIIIAAVYVCIMIKTYQPVDEKTYNPGNHFCYKSVTGADGRFLGYKSCNCGENEFCNTTTCECEKKCSSSKDCKGFGEKFICGNNDICVGEEQFSSFFLSRISQADDGGYIPFLFRYMFKLAVLFAFTITLLFSYTIMYGPFWLVMKIYESFMFY